MTSPHVINAIAISLAGMRFGPRKIRHATRREQALINELRSIDDPIERRRAFHARLRTIPRRQAAVLGAEVIDAECEISHGRTEWATPQLIRLPVDVLIRMFASRQFKTFTRGDGKIMADQLPAFFSAWFELLDGSTDDHFVEQCSLGRIVSLPCGSRFGFTMLGDTLTPMLAINTSLREQKTDGR